MRIAGPFSYSLSRYGNLWHLCYRRPSDGMSVEVFVRSKREAVAELHAAGIEHVEAVPA